MGGARAEGGRVRGGGRVSEMATRNSDDPNKFSPKNARPEIRCKLHGR